MTKETAIKLFEAKQVRTLWEPDQEKWYFSIVDVIAILTETDRPIESTGTTSRPSCNLKAVNCPIKSDS